MATANLQTSSATPDDVFPKFHELFSAARPCPDDCDDCAACDASSSLSPRTALALWLQAKMLADFAREDVKSLSHGTETIDGCYVLGQLPPACASMDDVWFARFAQCFDDLAAMLERGEVPSPTCTGEEMALHILLAATESDIAEAEPIIEMDNVDPFFRTFTEDMALAAAACPAHPTDLDIDALSGWLFEDTDVLFLLDMAFDGIEDSEEADAMGMVNLAPKKWFLPFHP